MTQDTHTEEQMRAARRKFLTSCGKFAVATPPAVALLLSASRQNYATAGSNGGFSAHASARAQAEASIQGNNGIGNGGSDGVPGASPFRDRNR